MGGIFGKSAGQVSTYAILVGGNVQVAENLQARGLRTRLDQGVSCTQSKICHVGVRHNANIGPALRGARGRFGKQMVEVRRRTQVLRKAYGANQGRYVLPLPGGFGGSHGLRRVALLTVDMLIHAASLFSCVSQVSSWLLCRRTGGASDHHCSPGSIK